MIPSFHCSIIPIAERSGAKFYRISVSQKIGSFKGATGGNQVRWDGFIVEFIFSLRVMERSFSCRPNRRSGSWRESCPNPGIRSLLKPWRQPLRKVGALIKKPRPVWDISCSAKIWMRALPSVLYRLKTIPWASADIISSTLRVEEWSQKSKNPTFNSKWSLSTV